MSTNILSIVFGFRDRDLERVQRCLDSLSQQTNMNFEVVFIDYGSSTELAETTKQLVESYAFCRYIYSDTRGWPWNRSKALNAGIQSARGEYILTSDIDLIFDRGVVDKLLLEMEHKKAVHLSCYYLPEGFYGWENIDEHKESFSLPAASALGLLCIEKKVLVDIGAYDEYYQFWGREDADLENRLHILGYETSWLNLEEHPVYHQWHPINNHETMSFMPSGYWEKAQFYFAENLPNVKRNQKGWGSVIETNNRMALQHISNNKAQVHIEKNLSKENLIKTVVKNFRVLNHGEVLVVEDEFVQPSKKSYMLFMFLNKILKKIGCGFFFQYKENIVRNFFFQFIYEYESSILDFAIKDDENHQRYILVKK